MPATAALSELVRRIDQVIPASKAGPGLPTGIPLLDQELGGGIPRGRVTELTGAMGSGKTALLRAVVTRALDAGQWVAWIDARRTLAPEPWARLGKRLVVVRPKEWKRAAWCADLLLRSGVFALVVLDGGPIVARNVGFRLAQIARERNAAFVVVSEEERATRISGTLRLEIRRTQNKATRRRPLLFAPSSRQAQTASSDPVQSTLTIAAPKSGFSVEVVCAVSSSMASRLCAHPEIPDRRGVARGSRRPWAPKSGHNLHEQEQHAVSWGGLGAAAVDHAAGRPGAPERDAPAARPPVRPDDRPVHVTPLDKADIERFQRETDRVAQQWSRFRKGRRRAAESTWGRQTRRERARERTGAHLESHLGQGWGKLVGKGRVEPEPRPSLGRVAAGAG